jgi:hypothetical protein
MESTETRIDWTGVQPDATIVAPLDSESFAARLRLLSERAYSVTILRNALRRQQPNHGEQLPRDPEPTSRPSR